MKPVSLTRILLVTAALGFGICGALESGRRPMASRYQFKAPKPG